MFFRAGQRVVLCKHGAMMQLLVMRHAKSDWESAAASDHERPLAERGNRAAEKMAGWLADQDLEPDLILSSTAVRARETVRFVVDQFLIPADRIVFDAGLYLGSAWSWFDVLAKQTAPCILICGHNPGLDDFVEHLSRDPLGLTDSGKLITTAAIAHFEVAEDWRSIAPGTGDLVSLTRPRHLN